MRTITDNKINHKNGDIYEDKMVCWTSCINQYGNDGL